jgi:regulator of cell morphogenesis and NO signaling
MPLDPNNTVGQLVVERPGRSRILEQLGIDYCCGGRKPIAQVCREKGLSLPDVLQKIESADAESTANAPAGADPATMTLGELCDHIERAHHAWLRQELPRLAGLLNKLANAHGDRDPRLVSLADIFESFAYDLFAHMQKEERVLFPALRRMERGELEDAQAGLLDAPIGVMLEEHDEAGVALRAMRDLTDGFAVPPGACNTHRAVLDALRTLEADMHQHVHKENNILFPKARHAAGLDSHEG